MHCETIPVLTLPVSLITWNQTFELLVGRWLFHPEEGEDWKLEDDHLAKMMELTDQTFPTKMLERAKLRNEYFDDSGMPLQLFCDRV